MEENVFNTEIGRKILALTKASFKVSDLIPDLVLREKIKSQILIVYKKFIEKNHSELLKEIDVLEYYFYLGGHLNLVKEEHLKQLQNGFLVFKSHIVLAMNQKSQLSTSDVDNSREADEETDVRRQEIPDVGRRINNAVEEHGDLTAKQKKIMEKFEIKDTLRLSEIMEIFPNVSERTVRNELSDLVNIGKITRSGIGSGSFYKIIDVGHQ